MMTPETLIERLSIALSTSMLHSLWQGLAIAFVLGLALRFVRPLSATQRYWLSTGALCTLFFTFVGTFFWQWGKFDGSTYELLATESLDYLPSAAQAVQTHWYDDLMQAFQQAQLFTQTYASELLLFWLLGAGMLSVRFTSGLWYVHKIRTQGHLPVSIRWQVMVDGLAEKMGIRKTVQLVESKLVEAPAVIGWVKPVILMPVSLMVNLSPQELEGIIAHELAHVKKHDYLINMVQSLIEAVLFFNPAAWWISGNINEERELSCDDQALAYASSKTAYVKALAGLAMTQPKQSFALSVTGQKGSILYRIRRIMNPAMAYTQRRNMGAEVAGRFTALLLVMLMTFTIVKASNSPLIQQLKSDFLQENLVVRPIDYSLDQWLNLPTDDTTKQKILVMRLDEENLSFLSDSLRIVDGNNIVEIPNTAFQTLLDTSKGNLRIGYFDSITKNRAADDTELTDGAIGAIWAKLREEIKMTHIDSVLELAYERLAEVDFTELTSEYKLQLAQAMEAIEKSKADRAELSGALSFGISDTIRYYHLNGGVVGIRSSSNTSSANENKSGRVAGVTIKSNRTGGANVLATAVPGEPIFIIDGKEVSRETLSNMDPSNIKSVEVLKGESAIAYYGSEQAADGVVIITTKGKAQKTEDTKFTNPDAEIQISTSFTVVEEPKVKIKVSDGEIAYFIDDKKVSEAVFKSLKPTEIGSIHIYNAKEDSKPYNLGGYTFRNGIAITTKKPDEAAAVESTDDNSESLVRIAKKFFNKGDSTAPKVVDIEISIEEVADEGTAELEAPGAMIQQTDVFPNPSNGLLNIGFLLKQDARVKAEVYDMAGKRVAQVYDKDSKGGSYTQFQWDAPSKLKGMFLLKIQAGNEVMQRKFVLE